MFTGNSTLEQIVNGGIWTQDKQVAIINVSMIIFYALCFMIIAIMLLLCRQGRKRF